MAPARRVVFPTKPFSSLVVLQRRVHTIAEPRWNTVPAVNNSSQTLVQEQRRSESRSNDKHAPTALARLSTAQLARNIVLGRLLANPKLFQFSLSILKRVASPRARFLTPDRNPLVKAIVRLCIYDQFCAGENAREVSRTVNSVKQAGYAGVILCPSREITVDFSSTSTGAGAKATLDASGHDEQIESWMHSHLTTLSMLGKDDYMGIKYTGAGQAVFNCLAEGSNPPPQLLTAIDAICKQAAAQESRIWIDAEEQMIQPAINRWTVDLMRKYNTQGNALVSNTYQAYLKKTPAALESHLRTAQSEGWTLGIKLVRGAYIGSETRSLIHDTKADTDRCYDSIAAGLITKTFPGFKGGSNTPKVSLMLAGHNTNSIHQASDTYEKAVRSGQDYTPTRWAQLQGMADEVACDLLHQSEVDAAASSTGQSVPRQIYKCLQWGTVGDCMQFLIRRATENNGAAERIADSSQRMAGEMRRRIATTFGRK